MSIIISIILGFLTTFLIKNLLIIDFLLSGNEIYVFMTIFWTLCYYFTFTKSVGQKEIEQENWDWIRITENRKRWERYFNSKVRDRVTGKPWFKIR